MMGDEDADDGGQPPVPDDPGVRLPVSEPHIDVKNSLQRAFEYSVNGIHYLSSKRFFQGKSFIFGGIRFLLTAFPDDKELAEDCAEIREDAKRIMTPRPSYSRGISQNMQVLEIKNPQPNTYVDTPPIGSPALVGIIRERDYDAILDEVLDLAWEVCALLVKRKLFDWEVKEFRGDYDDDTNEEEKDDSESEHGAGDDVLKY